MKCNNTDLYDIVSGLKGKIVSLYSLATWKNGLPFKKIDFSNYGKPIIKISELNNGITQSTAYTNQDFDRDVYLTKGDLVFSWSGNPDTSIDVFRYTLQDGWLNQHIFKVTANDDIVLKDYLFYILKWLKPIFKEIARNKQTTGLGHVTVADLKAINIVVPDFDLQRKIIRVLKPIDDKIELNKAINHNLQQQAHNIFKAKFTNNPNLGSIEKIPLAQLCSVITKGTTPTTLGKQFIKNGINFIKAESILDNHTIDKSKFNFIDEETNILLKRSIIHSGDIVFTIAGTLGRFALVSENIIPANTNQAVAIIRADRSKILPEYLYSCFIGEWHIDYYSKRVQQAVQANLSLSTIKSLPIPLLKNNEMEDYLRIIQPIFETIKANNHQNETLLNLRNTLLPRLMSGEIDVSEVDI